MKGEIAYAELKKAYPNTAIPYTDLLRTTEWKVFREEILKRDKYRCQGEGCNNLATDTMSDGKFIAFETKVYAEFDAETIEMVYQDRYYQLHVHHKYYIQSKLPWEYKPGELITLCQYCHEKIHRTCSSSGVFFDLEKSTVAEDDSLFSSYIENDFENDNPF